MADRAVAEAVLGGCDVNRRARKRGIRGAGSTGAVHEVVERGADIARVVRSGARGDSRGPEPARRARRRRHSHASATRSRGNSIALLEPGLGPYDTPDGWWSQLPKYVRAIIAALSSAHAAMSRATQRLQALVAPYDAFLEQVEAARSRQSRSASAKLRWMIEEYRLSLFAQDMRTLLPISAKRLDEQVAAAREA